MLFIIGKYICPPNHNNIVLNAIQIQFVLGLLDFGEINNNRFFYNQKHQYYQEMNSSPKLQETIQH